MQDAHAGDVLICFTVRRRALYQKFWMRFIRPVVQYTAFQKALRSNRIVSSLFMYSRLEVSMFTYS